MARAGLSAGASGLDLVFVFDSSASVGKANFQKGIAFAKTIIDEFGISNSTSGTRVAVVTFSSTAKIIFNLKTNAMLNKDEAIEVLGESMLSILHLADQWCFWKTFCLEKKLVLRLLSSTMTE